jgi:hypothetical protein
MRFIPEDYDIEVGRADTVRMIIAPCVLLVRPRSSTLETGSGYVSFLAHFSSKSCLKLSSKRNMGSHLCSLRKEDIPAVRGRRQGKSSLQRTAMPLYKKRLQSGPRRLRKQAFRIMITVHST